MTFFKKKKEKKRKWSSNERLANKARFFGEIRSDSGGSYFSEKLVLDLAV